MASIDDVILEREEARADVRLLQALLREAWGFVAAACKDGPAGDRASDLYQRIMAVLPRTARPRSD